MLGGTIKDGHRSPLEGTLVEFLINSVLGTHVRYLHGKYFVTVAHMLEGRFVAEPVMLNCTFVLCFRGSLSV